MIHATSYAPVVRNTRRAILIRWGLPLLVFVLAFIPRALSLGVFLTADEDDQLFFSAQFLLAMLKRDWAGALVLGYPGVPTMALGALGLWLRYQLSLISWPARPDMTPNFISGEQPTSDMAYRVFLPLVQSAPSPQKSIETMLFTAHSEALRYIPTMRLMMVIAASLGLLLIFIILRQLVAPKLALLASLLISFDPFFLANTRIIHVDAPLTYFMFASFLAFLLYLKKGTWGWLLASGVLGALAILSKTAGSILAPILAAGGAWYAFYLLPQKRRPQHLKRLLVALFGWGLVAAIAFFLFWPSMWGRPLFALTWIINNAKSALNTAHPSSGLFWGRLVTDQSPWYYLAALPFSLTPLTTIGSVLALGGIVFAFRERRLGREVFASRQLSLYLAAIAYSVIFLAIVSLASRRGLRYLLPIFPALDLLAALGLWQLLSLFRARWLRWGVGLAVAAQLFTALLFHPYYFDYFNPLLGGYRSAPYYVVIGWGEGMDQAARYLNQKPDADEMTVAAWYSWQFANYFKGSSVDLANNKAAYSADYTVFYINQVQRRFPSEELLNYFNDRLPEKTITLGGVDYAWLYPGPIIGRELPLDLTDPLNLPLNEAITLLGFNKETKAPGGQENPFFSPSPCRPLSSSSCLPLTLYWQPTASLPPDLNVSIRAVDNAGVVWGQVDRFPIGGLVRSDDWQPGDIIRDEYLLPLDPAAPPGHYTFDILLYTFDAGEILGQANRVGELTITQENALLEQQSTLLAALPDFHPFNYVQDRSSSLRLLGHTFEAIETLPGYKHRVKLYWQAEKALKDNYAVSLIARPSTGEDIILLTESIGPAEYPTSRWARGQVMAEAYTFAFPPDAPPGEYQLWARGNASAGALLGSVTLLEYPHSAELPETIQPLDALLGAEGEITLSGYQLSLGEGALDLILYWQPNNILPEDYKVFVHITEAGDAIIAQQDAIPAAGARPTTTWVPGEIIADPYHIPLPPGRYTVWVGMYNPVTGRRLPISGSAVIVSDDRLQLTTIEARKL